jgi:hypothetical protein
MFFPFKFSIAVFAHPEEFFALIPTGLITRTKLFGTSLRPTFCYRSVQQEESLREA